MKTKILTSCVVIAGYSFIAGNCLALTPVSDDFKGASLNTKLWKISNFENARLRQSSGRLNFTIGPKTHPEEDYAFAQLVNNQPGFNESWQVTLDVANTAAKGKRVGVGFWIFNADDPSDTVFFEFYGKGKGANGGFNVSFVLDGQHVGADLWRNPNVSSGSLRITFNKQTKLFTFYCDRSGSGGGYQWTRIGTFSPTGVGGDRRAKWQMNPGSGRFGIRLEGFGEQSLVSGGKATMDNFVLRASN